MVKRIASAVSTLVIGLGVFLAGEASVFAHEVEIHEHITSKAVDFLRTFPQTNIPDTCVANLKTQLKAGARAEDDFFPTMSENPALGRFFFHFQGPTPSSPLNDVVLGLGQVQATCDATQWTEFGRACQASFRIAVGPLFWNYDISPVVTTNDFSLPTVMLDLGSAAGSPAHNNGLRGLGRFLHLLQDLTSPAHTRNDAHPPGWDPSLVELLNANRPENDILVPAARDLIPFASPTDALRLLQHWTMTRFRSEKDIQFLTGPGPDVFEPDGNYVRDFEHRLIARKVEAGPPNAPLVIYMIDDLVARVQFNELAMEAVVYTASMIDHLVQGGVVLCPPPSDGILNFEGLGAGQVLSRCTDGGTLPSCLSPNGVDNVIAGLTFYSTTGGPRLTGGGEVRTFTLPPPPAGLTGTQSIAICAAAATPSGVDCKVNLFIKFAPGVTEFAYTVVGGYTFRSNFFLPDDFNGLIYYGPQGLQIDQSFNRMFFVWERLMDRGHLNLTNITGFEFFTTNSHVDTWGLSGQGGLAIDEISFTAP